LDDIECIGNETNLGQCDHKAWSVNDCTHQEDVGVMCLGMCRLHDCIP